MAKDEIENRQLNKEGHLQMPSVEQREYMQLCACAKVAKNSGIITDLQHVKTKQPLYAPNNTHSAVRGGGII